MVRAYEALYIVHPDLSDEDITAIMERYKQIVEEQGGVVEELAKWEKRRLAYKIKGQHEGTYVLMRFSSEPPVQAELNRLLKIGDNVLRHIIVCQEEK